MTLLLAQLPAKMKRSVELSVLEMASSSEAEYHFVKAEEQDSGIMGVHRGQSTQQAENTDSSP